VNLRNSPSEEELRSLIACCNDYEAHHILWVDKAGYVYISVLPEELTPAAFEESLSQLLFRYETFAQGNGYAGPSASRDNEYVMRLFGNLLRDWNLYQNASEPIYIDIW
jgi:hypothetical protein